MITWLASPIIRVFALISNTLVSVKPVSSAKPVQETKALLGKKPPDISSFSCPDRDIL